MTNNALSICDMQRALAIATGEISEDTEQTAQTLVGVFSGTGKDTGTFGSNGKDKAKNDQKDPKKEKEEKKNQAKVVEDLKAQIARLRALGSSTSLPDEGPVVYCLTWHDGERYQAALKMCMSYEEEADFKDVEAMTDFKEKRQVSVCV